MLVRFKITFLLIISGAMLLVDTCVAGQNASKKVLILSAQTPSEAYSLVQSLYSPAEYIEAPKKASIGAEVPNKSVSFSQIVTFPFLEEKTVSFQEFDVSMRFLALDLFASDFDALHAKVIENFGSFTEVDTIVFHVNSLPDASRGDLATSIAFAQDYFLGQRRKEYDVTHSSFWRSCTGCFCKKKYPSEVEGGPMVLVLRQTADFTLNPGHDGSYFGSRPHQPGAYEREPFPTLKAIFGYEPHQEFEEFVPMSRPRYDTELRECNWGDLAARFEVHSEVRLQVLARIFGVEELRESQDQVFAHRLAFLRHLGRLNSRENVRAGVMSVLESIFFGERPTSS